MTPQNKRTLPIALVVAVGVAGIALAAAWAVAQNKERDPMAVTTPDIESNVVPPIDAAVPAQVETATFALG
jgi:hypothetical protein